MMLPGRAKFGGLIMQLAVVVLVATGCQETQSTQLPLQTGIPSFEYDPTWPQPLPNGWLTGNIGAMAVDRSGHIWIVQRPGSTTNLSERYGLEGFGECCFPAPPVMQFDQDGKLLRAWGPIHDDQGQLLGAQPPGHSYPDGTWPTSEHAIYVDHADNVWIGGNSPPSQILKLSSDGELLLRIGMEEATSSNDTLNLAGPAGIVVDPTSNEVFIADGYRNRRIVVFDGNTGAYKRHWGAYGRRPSDGPQGSNPIEGNYVFSNVRSEEFATVHCIAMSRDGLLYVCDRVNNRVQVFEKDGTFVKEGLIAPESRGFGAVHAISFSADEEQRYLYVADGANKKVWVVNRDDLNVVGSFSSGGRGGGQLLIAHAMVTDEQGNVYVGETINNNRVQRFKLTGMGPVPTD